MTPLQNVRLLAAGLSLLFGGLSLAADSSPDSSPDQARLLEQIVSVQKERELIYGNMHAVWTEKKVVGFPTQRSRERL